MTDKIKEYIPTPQQIMSLVDAGIKFKAVTATSHNIYYIYFDDLSDVDQFTIDLIGLQEVSRTKNNITNLTNALQSWDDTATLHRFNVWLEHHNLLDNTTYIPPRK